MYDRNVLTAMSKALLVLLDYLSCSRVLEVAYSSGLQISAFLTPAILRPFRLQVVAVYLRHWYPFLISGWWDLRSACAQSQFYADDFLKFVD